MKKQKKRQSNLIYKLTCVSIAALAATIAACLLVYCFPSLPGDTVRVIRIAAQTCGKWADSSRQAFADWWDDRQNPDFSDGSLPTDAVMAVDVDDSDANDRTAASSQDDQSRTEAASTQHQTLAPSNTLGAIPDLDNFDVPDDFASYYIMLDTAAGPMIYYNQGDSRWADYLYGGKEPLDKYGCGPTAVSMLVSSFSDEGGGLSPVELADWATENGFYAPGSGSYHTLIENSLTHYGFTVESVRERTVEHTSDLLENGYVLVALVKRGSLTNSAGHFILITKLLDNGNVWIADPNSYENSRKEWKLDLLLSELKIGSGGGGPLWAVRPPE